MQLQHTDAENTLFDTFKFIFGHTDSCLVPLSYTFHHVYKCLIDCVCVVKIRKDFLCKKNMIFFVTKLSFLSSISMKALSDNPNMNL